MTIVLQQGINGIVLGSLYVLVALGLTLIYGVLVQINFAHADIVTLGAFSAYFFMHDLRGGYIPSIAVALVVGGILGWMMNAAIFAPLQKKGSELLPLIATIGARTCAPISACPTASRARSRRSGCSRAARSRTSRLAVLW
jgi:branched-chain amino acid transport system permease protein